MLKGIVFTLLLGIALCCQGQQVVNVMHYNLLRYGDASCGPSLEQKDTWLETVLTNYQPDILTVNEFSASEAFANRIRVRSFTYTDNIEYGDITNNTGSPFGNAIFYNEDQWGYLGVEVISGSIRDINVFKLYHLEATKAGDTTMLYCIVTHFKASDSADDRNQRAASARSIMDWMEDNAPNGNVLLLGDLNLGDHTETAWQELMNNPSNVTVRFRDPINKQNGWSGASNAIHHTQSPRNSSSDCGAGGGMDDRFDFILATQTILNGTKGIKYVPDSYAAYGNNGDSYNTELFCSSSGPVPLSLCIALKQLSDHLPVVMQLEIDGVSSLEITSLKEWGFTLYPQPAEGRLFLRANGERSGQHKVEISNMTGQLIQTENINPLINNNWELDISELPVGIYHMRVTDPESKYAVQSFLKQ